MMQLAIAFTTITVFAQMLVVGLRFSPATAVRFVTNPNALLRAIAAVLVLAPVAAFLLIRLLQLPPDVASGLAILAAAPAAPVSTRRSIVAGANRDYVATVQFVMALAAVVFTPVMIAIFQSQLDLPGIGVAPLDVAAQISKMTLAPVLIGVAMRRIAAALSERHVEKLAKIADLMLLVLLIVVVLALIFATELRASLMIGWAGAFAAALMATAALAGGHCLGGPTHGDRVGLAIAAAARNLGLALYITEIAPDAMAAAPTILFYALIGAIVAMPYSIWAKRREPFGSHDKLQTSNPS